MLLTLQSPEPLDPGFAHLTGNDPPAMRTFDLPEGRAHLFRTGVHSAALILESELPTPAEAPSPPAQATYAAGALLGSALDRIVDSASVPESDAPRLIEVRLPALWSPAGETIFTRLFAPLGYRVDAARLPPGPEQPWAGKSPYCSVGLSGRHRLGDVLGHLSVLLPLVDGRPRGMSDGHAAVLWEKGRAWLETHPEREVLERLLLRRPSTGDGHERRHEAVLAALKECGARRVLDLGCGVGTLLQRLLEEPRFEEVVGVEVARRELAEAASRMVDDGRGRVLHGSLAYRDARLAGFDAAALVEVVEHLDPPQLASLEGAVWEVARPGTVVVTTPNVEYNSLFENYRGGRLRHPDHRFEWTRHEFHTWARAVAARHGYTVRFGAAGPEDARVGPLTQMAVFERTAGSRTPGSPTDGNPSPAGLDAGIRLEDVAGERTIPTRLAGGVRIRADEAAAALEEMSRFAVDPRWLVYLPPTTPAAPALDDVPEHPAAAMACYRARGVAAVALQELHAGTRVVTVVCRDAIAAERHFRVSGGATGVVHSVTGRPFFATRVAEEAFLARVRDAMESGGLWERLATDWMALEGVMGPGVPAMREMNPRLRPAPALHPAVAAAVRVTLEAEEAALARAVDAGVDAAALLARTRRRAADAAAYAAACRRVRSPARTPADLRLAPIRLLGAHGALYAERSPDWHREQLAAACDAAPHTLRGTEQRVIDLARSTDPGDGLAWWNAVLARGGAGIAVRPLERPPDAVNRPLPPALQCRGEDALRLVHGPEPILARARARRIDQEMNRAAGEWALSIEALERFIRGESTTRVHECVFGALALKLGSRP
jgi:SAM-dependent methyltransferase